MIQYLVILLDDAAVSFCSYESGKEHRLMPLETLQKGIRYAMTENLNVQFVYPDTALPDEYLEAIDSIDHTDIVGAHLGHLLISPLTGGHKNPPLHSDALYVPDRKENESVGAGRPKAVFARPHINDSQILVIDSITQLQKLNIKAGADYVLRTDKTSLFNNWQTIVPVLKTATRLNIVLTDIETFISADFDAYKEVLRELSEEVEKLYIDGRSPQINILTDRMMLQQMNNCDAGDTTITLAPNGKFYVCPAFYYAGECNGKETGAAEVCTKGYDIGSLDEGLNIRNPQLYRLDHAPICRHCDAYQCRRCIWLNRLTTLDINTPSHEQCVVAHLERNASLTLLNNIRKHGTFLPDRPEIPEIKYLDPFDIKDQWQQ